MSNHRPERVRELLKREIGEAIRREIPIDQAGLVTVNDVQVSGDFRVATVFISILGGAAQQKHGLALLRKHRPLIQSFVAKAVILKYTPQLRFLVDDSVSRGNRVVKLLEDLEKIAPPAPEA